jgi:arsenite-transporting ATPase
VLSRAAGVPMPHDSVFAAVARFHDELTEVHELLTGKDSTVRLVLTPERVVLAEARRSLTTLSLFGYCVDGVVANRVFPAGGADGWRSGWVHAQREVLRSVAESFGQLPVWTSAYQPEEPVGVAQVAEFAAAAYAGSDPLDRSPGEGPLAIRRTPTGAALRLALPFAERSEVDLARHGDELVLTVGSHRRLLVLPTALRAMTVAGARVADGELRVRFVQQEEEAR